MKDEVVPSDELILPLHDVEATEQLGAVLASELSDGLVVFLLGDLGAGKTSLVRGVLRELGHSGAVKSPTYTLLEEYSVAGRDIIHFDLYRMIEPEELDLIGIRDYFNGKNCCFFEWPQRGQGYLPAADLQIQISLKGNGRLARMTSNSESGRAILKAIQTELCQES
jgi:tRNA threonylcarbamoyladenosine biosynthesis protein TsaE